MYEMIKPFVRVLLVAPLMFCFGYLSFFTPYRLLKGQGFTHDLQLALVTIGIFTGLLFFTKPRKEIELYSPGAPELEEQESGSTDQKPTGQ